MKFFLILPLFFSFSAHAALPANFDSARWDKLARLVMVSGEKTPTSFGQTSSLSLPTPGRIQYLTADMVDEKMGIAAKSFAMVDEIRTTNTDGSQKIDQFLFWLSSDGDVVKAAEYQMVSKDSVLLSRQEIFSREPNGEDLNRWSLSLADWFKFADGLAL